MSFCHIQFKTYLIYIYNRTVMKINVSYVNKMFDQSARLFEHFNVLKIYSIQNIYIISYVPAISSDFYKNLH